MNEISFVAIGNDELGAKVKKGDKVIKDGLSGILEYGIDEKTGKLSNLLGFVEAQDGKSYVVSVRDQLVFGWEKCDD
jgi:hypothetical protein